MQIHLPDDAAPLIHEQAAAAGFPNQIDAYIAHLIASDALEDCGAPAELSLAGKSRAEIDRMITDGVASGPATPMTGDDWRRLHTRADARDSSAQDS